MVDGGDLSCANTLKQDKLRKKVVAMIREQNLQAVKQIVKIQTECQPWSQAAKAKV